MPAKILKTDTGRVIVIKSVLLPNGNLLIPARMEEDRKTADWREVEPGTSDYKRWLPVAENEADPRDSKEYIEWKQALRQLKK